jgi:hypothetical protein
MLLFYLSVCTLNFTQNLEMNIYGDTKFALVDFCRVVKFMLCNIVIRDFTCALS